MIATGQQVFVFENHDLFVATTDVVADVPLPNVGEVPTQTVGNLSYSPGPGASSLFLGTGMPDVQWTTRNTGHDIALGGMEDLDIDLAIAVNNIGFEFVEPETDPNLDGPFVESEFEVTLKNGGEAGAVIGSFTFTRPNDVLSFVGVAAASEFNRVEIRETTGGGGNEFFGQFYSGRATNQFWTPAGSGEWSDPGNWSGGKLPGGGDAVFIAPASPEGGTISGPTVETSVRSLHLGDATTTAVHLQIQSTGSLVVAEPVFIGSNGAEQASITLFDVPGTRMHSSDGTFVADGGRLNLFGGEYSTASLVVHPGGVLDHKTNAKLRIIGGSFDPGGGSFEFGPTNLGPTQPAIALESGATAVTDGLEIGQGSVALLSASIWTVNGAVIVGGLQSAGAGRTASLTIEGGGNLVSTTGHIGVVDPFREAIVEINGAGSHWTVNSVLEIGPFSSGSLHIRDGGSVFSQVATIGDLASGSARIEGQGSLWTNTGSLFMGTTDAELEIVDGGTVTVGNDLRLNANSTLRLDGGHLQSGPGGEISLGGGQFEWTSGTLSANRFQGSLVQGGGTLRPGFAPGDIAFGMTITGAYTIENGGIQFELGGTTPMEQFDQVAVEGAVVLRGRLDVELFDLGQGLFEPAAGDTFDLLTSAVSVSGMFDELELPPLNPGLEWSLLYEPNRVRLEVLGQLLAGDYNNSGLVEQGDLDLVLLNWGNAAEPPPTGWTSDLPGGMIDQDELDGVLLNWGSAAGLAGGATLEGGRAAIPEPASHVSLLVILFVLLIRPALRRLEFCR